MRAGHQRSKRNHLQYWVCQRATEPFNVQTTAADGRYPVLKPFLDAMPTTDWLPLGWTQVGRYFQNAGAQVNGPKAFLDRAQAVAMGSR